MFFSFSQRNKTTLIIENNFVWGGVPVSGEDKILFSFQWNFHPSSTFESFILELPVDQFTVCEFVTRLSPEKNAKLWFSSFGCAVSNGELYITSLLFHLHSDLFSHYGQFRVGHFLLLFTVWAEILAWKMQMHGMKTCGFAWHQI